MKPLLIQSSETKYVLYSPEYNDFVSLSKTSIAFEYFNRLSTASRWSLEEINQIVDEFKFYGYQILTEDEAMVVDIIGS